MNPSVLLGSPLAPSCAWLMIKRVSLVPPMYLFEGPIVSIKWYLGYLNGYLRVAVAAVLLGICRQAHASLRLAAKLEQAGALRDTARVFTCLGCREGTQSKLAQYGYIAFNMVSELQHLIKFLNSNPACFHCRPSFHSRDHGLGVNA